MIFTLVFHVIRNVFFTALEISVKKKSLNIMVCFCKWRGQAPCFSVPGTLLPAKWSTLIFQIAAQPKGISLIREDT